MKTLIDIEKESYDRASEGNKIDNRKREREFQTLLKKEIEAGKEEIIEKLSVWKAYAKLQSELPGSPHMLNEFFSTHDKIAELKEDILYLQDRLRVLEREKVEGKGGEREGWQYGRMIKRGEKW